MQWLQDPSQSNIDNMNNVKRDARRHFRRKDIPERHNLENWN